MRKIWALIFVASLALTVYLITPTNWIKYKVRKPIENYFEKEENEKTASLERTKWIEQMHRAAPGTDWRAMDEEVCWQKYQERLNSYKTGNNNVTAANENIGAGKLFGYWVEKGSANQAGRIHTATMDTVTGAIYAISSGGNIWKGDINGTNWTVLNDKLPFLNSSWIKVIYMGSGFRILVAAGTKFYYSDDDGTTWKTATGLTNIINYGPQSIRRAVMMNDSANTIYLMTSDGGGNSLNRSNNKGTSFTKVKSYATGANNGLNRHDIWTSPTKSTDTYMLINNNIYSVGSTGLPVLITTFNTSSPGSVLLTGCMDTSLYLYAYINQNIYRSTDGGQNWAFRDSIGKTPFTQNSFICSPSDPNFLLFGDIDCHKSTNGGQSFNNPYNWYDYYNDVHIFHGDLCGFNYLLDNNNTELLLIATDGGLYKSYDNILSNTNISLNKLNISQYYDTYTNKNDPNIIYAGAQDQGFQRCTQDSGNVVGFQQVWSGDYGHFASHNGGNSLWMIYPATADYWEDATTEQYPTKDWAFDGNTHFWMPPTCQIPGEQRKIWLAGKSLSNQSGSRILELDANGSDVTASELPFDFNTPSNGGNISAMAISPIDSNYCYVFTDNGRFFYSTDKGQNWTITNPFNGPAAQYFYGACILPSPTTLGTVYVSGSGYSNATPVFKTVDHGVTFTAMSNGLPATLVYEIATSPNEDLLFAASDVGPYVYIKSTNTWYDMTGQAAPVHNYWTVEYVPSINAARFGTYGRGIWDFVVTDAVSVNKKDANKISIYPNPTTDMINISMNEKIETIRIFDLAGKIVYDKNLRDKNSSTLNISISELNTGTYLIEAVSNKQKITNKFIKQ